MSTDEELRKVLLENGQRKYFMLISAKAGYNSNHLTHAVVAIHRLGGDVKRMQRYIEKNCVGFLEDPDGPTAKSQITPETDINKLLGVEQNYHILMKYYKNKYEKEYHSNLEEFIRQEYSKMSAGASSAAFHGLIQIGYGYSARAPYSVYEGFAYLHHAYRPLKLSNPDFQMGKGTKNILKVLEEFKNDKDILSFYNQHVPCDTETRFTRRVGPLLSERGDKLLSYVTQIDLPIRTVSCTMDDVRSLGKWLVHCAVVVFAKCENRNDFFLLHGVTGAWSLLQVLEAFTDVNKALVCIQNYLCCFLAAYRAQRCPDLNRDMRPEEFKYGTWEEIIAATLASDFDAHIFKLVQVVSDLSKTAPDPDNDIVYKAAANIKLKYF